MQILKTNIVFAFGKLVCQTQGHKYPHVNGVMRFFFGNGIWFGAFAWSDTRINRNHPPKFGRQGWLIKMRVPQFPSLEPYSCSEYSWKSHGSKEGMIETAMIETT